MKKFLLGFIRVIGVMAVLGIGAVIALDQYYQNVFPLFVTINGEYCTGMTVGRVTDILNDSYDLHADKISVRTLDGAVYELPLDQYGVTISYKTYSCRIYETVQIQAFSVAGGFSGEFAESARSPNT